MDNDLKRFNEERLAKAFEMLSDSLDILLTLEAKIAKKTCKKVYMLIKDYEYEFIKDSKL